MVTVWRNNIIIWLGIYLSITKHLCLGAKVYGETCSYKAGNLNCVTDLIDKMGGNSLIKESCANHKEIKLPPVLEITTKPTTIKPITEDREKPGDPSSHSGCLTAIPLAFSTPSHHSSSDQEDSFTKNAFYEKGGYSIIVSHDKMTAYKKTGSGPGYGMAFSEKEIGDGNIFYVWVTNVDTVDHPWIGVTTESPKSIVFPDYMVNMRCGTWIWDTYSNQIIVNGEVLKKPYTNMPLHIENGDRFGVSIENGDLHFHHNGRDLGAAVKGLNGKYLYAFIDLHLEASAGRVVE